VLIVTVAFFDVLSPYYSAILWAAILAVIFHPVKNKLRDRIGERNGLAAFLTIVIICLIVFTPLALILSSLAFELNVVYSKLQHNDTQFPAVVACLLTCRNGQASFQSIILIARNTFSGSFRTLRLKEVSTWPAAHS
jgi:predicted PurR-regulated permease PerM